MKTFKTLLKETLTDIEGKDNNKTDGHIFKVAKIANETVNEFMKSSHGEELHKNVKSILSEKD